MVELSSAASITARVIASLDEVAADQWNALDATDNPFLSHQFLSALENTGCVGGPSGWHPEHITLWQNNQLVAAAPAYRKDHSFGEYVFDFAWADAYRRAGLRYYPKLLVAVPFSPVTGPRLLVHPHHAAEPLKAKLIDALIAHCHARGYSTAHILFPDGRDRQHLAASGMIERSGFQFHWRNEGYAAFDDYLSALSARKRKNIQRERRQVHEAGIHLRVITGAQVQEVDWNRFYQLYRLSAEIKGGSAYLTRAFFEELARRMPQRIVLVEAARGAELIAYALCLRSGDTLYGRNWGTSGFYPGLHFDACYYTPLEYCIEQGIQHFDAGAQGEHKLARGFLPMPTYSFHWVAHSEFRDILRRYLKEETRHVEHYVDELEAAGPYKKQ